MTVLIVALGVACMIAGVVIYGTAAFDRSVHWLDQPDGLTDLMDAVHNTQWDDLDEAQYRLTQEYDSGGPS